MAFDDSEDDDDELPICRNLLHHKNTQLTVSQSSLDW
jgi:hypothetical protein